jgi:hypothetical protein
VKASRTEEEANVYKGAKGVSWPKVCSRPLKESYAASLSSKEKGELGGGEQRVFAGLRK